jgi:hypothetical protein
MAHAGVERRPTENENREMSMREREGVQNAPLPTPLSAPVPAISAEAVDFTVRCHGNLQDMIRLADGKATTLMGATGVIGALLGSNLIDKFVAKNVGGAVLWLGALTLLLLLAAALCAILVLVPRFPGTDEVAPIPGAPGLMWRLSRFNRGSGDYFRLLVGVTHREVIADFGYESLKITWILERKWKWLARAAWLLVGAFFAWAATLVRVVWGA